VCMGSHLFLGLRGVTAEAVRQRAFAECSKRCCIHLHTFPTPADHALDSTRYGKPYSKWAPQLPKLRVRRQNPLVRSMPPRSNSVRDKVTQRVASSWHTRGPIEGTQHPQVLYLSPGWEVSFMPHHVDWHLAIRVSSIRIT
jgi:hypothetical protein